MTIVDYEYPNPSDQEIVTFCELHNLGNVQQLDFTEVDKRYKKDFCHVSVKHAAQAGGKRVHGWALWKHKSGMIVGNFHSVWEDENGVLVDVTPPKVGNRILFIRHDILTIKKSGNNHQLFHCRTSNPKYKIMDNNGSPTSAKRFDLPIQNDLKEYCESLDLDDASMV